ncbi:hypothetical protein [Kordia jejudonensis]|uniref:hypothetical protein n=1 Tax=Kordia jejudonensis TaxID=1348245 RepID=UPI000629845A|nr:hypothetical protein [Kordia jejudonensis]
MKSHNIKDILEERRMDVSENSWEQLASQLDANDKKKTRRNIYPYAACLALLIGLATFIIGKNIGEKESQTIANTEKEIQIEEAVKTPKQPIYKDAIDSKTSNEVIVVQEELPKKEATKTPKRIATKAPILLKEEKETAVALQKEIQKPVVDKNKIESKIVVPIITQKEIVVAANDDIKASIIELSIAEKITITDAEIDQLMKEATASLSELDIKKDDDTMRFATADELLNEVENELDTSFRQKVFEIIKKNFKKGKTLLADRN